MKQESHHKLIADMLYWLIENQSDQPGLTQLANQFGLSEFHIQRTFQDFAGVSPKQFLKFLTKEKAKSRLKAGNTVFDTSLDCGLSGPGRLHDLLVSTEAITPGEARRAGNGVEISFGFGSSPFGDCLVAWTQRGLCFLGFCHDAGRSAALLELRQQWPAARYQEQPSGADELSAQIFNESGDRPLPVWLHGTPFQLSVWQALLRIPPGTHCSYGQIARALGKPKAARAVGTAVGDNPISLLIPCHRVITSAAGLGGYRWGLATKKAIIGYEAARPLMGQEPAAALG